MSNILFSISAVSILIGLVLQGSTLGERERRDWSTLFFGTVLSVVLVGLVDYFAKAHLDSAEVGPACSGLIVGGLASLGSAFLATFLTEAAMALAVSTAVSSFLLLQGTAHLGTNALAAMVGAGIVAAAIGKRSSHFAALAIAAVSLCQLLTNYDTASSSEIFMGPALSAALTVFSVLGLLIARNQHLVRFWPLTVCVLCVLATAVIAKSSFGVTGQWYGLIAIPVAAGVVYWMERSYDRGKLTASLSGLIWTGIASVAFGLGRNAGLGLALVVPILMLILLGRERPILTAGLLIGMALNRAMRVEHSGIGGAFDVGQFYVLIGFMLGIFLPLLPQEWIAGNPRIKKIAGAFGSATWVLTCLAGPTLISLFLAPKGLLGFVTGLGLSGAVAAAESKPSLTVTSLAAAIGGVGILEYSVVEKLDVQSRDDKIHWFGIGAACIVIVAAVLGGLSLLKSNEEVQSA